MAFQIIQQDITKVEVDAIVNAANNKLVQGGGVCGAIFHAAGIAELTATCSEIGFCATGDAVITEAFGLRARYIIHTVGPLWNGGRNSEEAALRACYENSLRLAIQYRCKSIAFPLISSGIYGYPKQLALEIAISTIKEFLYNSEVELDVTLVVFDRATVEVSEGLALDVQRYMHEHLVQYSRTSIEPLIMQSEVYEAHALRREEPVFELDETLRYLDETFAQKLIRLIDERGNSDPEVYKRANVSRKHFSKIRNDIHYNPSKKTAIAFAISLELSIEETQELLESAGYALTNSRKFDVIIKYFIERSIYDIFKINEVLFLFEEPLLGA